MSDQLSPLPLAGEVAVPAAGEGLGPSFVQGRSAPQEPSPGPERPTSPRGRGHTTTDIDCSILTDFLNNGSGLDLTDIVAVRLDVGPAHGSPEGRIVIDDLMLSNDRAVYDARDNGDPHIKTVNGTNYDFHGAGEYTLLRDGTDYEIQTRQTPVTTANPLPNGYTGLSSCVAVNTALAARVGDHRITRCSSFFGLTKPLE